MAERIAALPEVNRLLRKIYFTLGFLAVYRIGVHIPIPGVKTDALADFFRGQGSNFFGMVNTYVGGALERFSVCALGVLPYISASIIVQMLTVIVPSLEALSKEGDAGRRKITQYTRYGTVVLGLIQGYMISRGLASGVGGQSLVHDPSTFWMIFATISLVAGTCFVMWLGEQITDRGIGNGISLIIFAGIVAEFPKIVTNTYEKYHSAEMTLGPILVMAVACIAICAGVVFIEQGARQVPIQYAKRQVGRRQFGGQSTTLPLRINSSGVIPPIFASSLLQIPLTIGSFYQDTVLGSFVNTYMLPGQWLYNTVFCSLILFFAFFYTSIVFRPDDIAENLKKNGGFVPGIRPGPKTAHYLDTVITRLTLAGAIYLSGICILPSIMAGRFDVQFSFGGTSLLIVVGVALDTFRQIEAHRQSLRYDAFLKQSGSVGKAGRIRRR